MGGEKMQTKFFCDLYVSEGWEERKLKLIKKLQKNKLQPSVYVITLSQRKQNHLEYYSSLLLKQHIFDNASLFIVGIANGYDGALSLIERIAEEAYEKTGEVNLRKFLLDRQEEFEKKEIRSV
jgi:hypothetical protein